MEQPNYYSIIPANVRYDKELKANEKLLFSEITALANRNGYCHAWNSYFADLYGVSKTTISNWINHLKERGYLKIEIVKQGKEIKERKLFPVSTPVKENFNTPSKKSGEGIKEKSNTPIKENFKENITSINNTRVNKDDDDTHARAKDSSTSSDDPFTLAGHENINVNSGLHMPVFIDFIDRLGSPVVCWAIRKTADNASHPNWSYLLTVMKSLEANGVRTVEAAEKLSEHHSQQTKQRYKPKYGHQHIEEPLPEWAKKADKPKKRPSKEFFESLYDEG